MHDDRVLEIDGHSCVGQEALADRRQLGLAGRLTVDHLAAVTGEVRDHVLLEAHLVRQVGLDEELLERTCADQRPDEPLHDVVGFREPQTTPRLRRSLMPVHVFPHDRRHGRPVTAVDLRLGDLVQHLEPERLVCRHTGNVATRRAVAVRRGRKTSGDRAHEGTSARFGWRSW